MKNKLKKAFSLGEALMFLLVSCLLIMSTIPLITKRHYILPENTQHGKWACKYINGELYSAVAGNVNQKLPADSKWTKGCEFPELPKSVSYIIVQVIGGGAAGQKGDLSIGTQNNVTNLFPSGIDGEEYTVEETGKFQIYFPGDIGKKGILSPSLFDVVLGGIKYMSCSFNRAEPNPTVPSVTFTKNLKRGDKLILNIDSSGINNNFNGEGEHVCNPNDVVMAEWIDEKGVKHLEPYKFQVVVHEPGNNGRTRILSIIPQGGAKNRLVEIKGGGGGYYSSSTDACSIDCSRRYSAAIDRASWDIDKYISASGLSDLSKSFSSNRNAQLISQGYTIDYHGGCGGAAGQVNTVVMEKPKKKPEIKIGKGGINGGNGEDTKFDYIIASGGIGCSNTGINVSENGTDGGKANTMASVDSSPGSGGKGKIGSPMPSISDMSGKDAKGLGSGGGGGGFGLNITDSIDNYLNSSAIYQLENYKVLGNAGNGSSGGIILSW